MFLLFPPQAELQQAVKDAQQKLRTARRQDASARAALEQQAAADAAKAQAAVQRTEEMAGKNNELAAKLRALQVGAHMSHNHTVGICARMCGCVCRQWSGITSP